MIFIQVIHLVCWIVEKKLKTDLQQPMKSYLWVNMWLVVKVQISYDPANQDWIDFIAYSSVVDIVNV